MPQAVLRFYSKFPLVVLPAETSPIVEKITEPTLWVSRASTQDVLMSIMFERAEEEAEPMFTNLNWHTESR